MEYLCCIFSLLLSDLKIIFICNSFEFLRFAFDLYKNMTRNVNLSFTNPYHKTTAVSYNHKTKVRMFNR